MSRRAALPGADELFRATAPAGSATATEPSGPAPSAPVEEQSDRPSLSVAPASGAAPRRSVAEPVRATTADIAATDPSVGQTPGVEASGAATGDDLDAGGPKPVRARRRPHPIGERRPSGRERHDEKITVYVSAEELVGIEHARLSLRAEHGLAVDRGRIVREAIAVVLADLDAKGDASILVRRLTGR